MGWLRVRVRVHLARIVRVALAEASAFPAACPGETGAALSAALGASVGRHVLQLRLEFVSQRHGARHLTSTYLVCCALWLEGDMYTDTYSLGAAPPPTANHGARRSLPLRHQPRARLRARRRRRHPGSRSGTCGPRRRHSRRTVRGTRNAAAGRRGTRGRLTPAEPGRLARRCSHSCSR